MSFSVRSYTLAAALGALAGCGDEPQTAAPVAQPARNAKPVAASNEVAQVDYVYNPINKRDPFRSLFTSVEIARDGDALKGQCTEPLCQLDVDELVVVGVVSGDANPVAMVEDKAGVGHLVRRNSRIGKQGGKVTQILRDCIVVTSFISGGSDSKPQANKQNLCVQTDARSEPAMDLLKGKEFTQ